MKPRNLVGSALARVHIPRQGSKRNMKNNISSASSYQQVFGRNSESK